MKIDRLIGILSILLQQEKVTAPYLAEKFEVSRRTINRDIEHLCQAGIPIVTAQGYGGGISIMEGYRIDRTLLTASDMQAILVGLKSLDSISRTNRYRHLMDKLHMENPAVLPSNQHIIINLASWYKPYLAPKVELIQKAIEEHQAIHFRYYSPKEESERVIEPCLLVFQWTSWYVWGYCRLREDFRLFKLNRLLDLALTGETFIPRPTPEFTPAPREFYHGTLPVTVRVKPESKWRLIEEFGPESFTLEPDGSLLFSFTFCDKENLFSWLLSLGAQAELLTPENLREEFFQLLSGLAQAYRPRPAET